MRGKGEKAPQKPWEAAEGLEWEVPSPAPFHTFETPPKLDARARQQRPQVDISFPEIEKFDHLPPARVDGATAFVSIMEGCSKYCSYCVVPYTRGEEVSRPFDDVLTEIAGLAAQGLDARIERRIRSFQRIDRQRSGNQRRIEGLAAFVLRVVEHLGGDPRLAGALQPVGIGAVGNHRADACRAVGCGAAVDQGLEVAAGTGD
eukprot:gene14112-17250_t